MGSIWEWVGEQVGYGLAALVLGPGALAARRARRRTRRAFLRFAHDHEPIAMDTPEGTLRRMIRLEAPEGTVPMQLDLKLSAGRGWVPASLWAEVESLPRDVELEVSQSVSAILGNRLPMADARATRGTIRLDGRCAGTDIALEIAESLLDLAERGHLATLQAFVLKMVDGGIELHVLAPEESAEWEAHARALLEIVAWSQRTWKRAYRR